MHYPTPLFPIIVAKLFGGNGQGASVTPASVLTALEGMDSSQQSDARAAIGATDALTSIPDDVKQALMNVVQHIGAWTGNKSKEYIAELNAALYCGPLDSISAVFTQVASAIYDTDQLDELRQYLTVTAHYSVAGDVVVTGYDLSGTLTVGTSTVTVSYGGKTTTVSITVKSGFHYTPDRGLLSEQQYISTSTNGSPSITETIENGFFRIQCTSTASVSNYKTYAFSPNRYGTSCEIIVKFVVVSCGYYSTSTLNATGAIEILGAKGTSDAADGYAPWGFARQGSQSGDVKIIYVDSSLVYHWGAAITASELHTARLVFDGEKSSLYVDGAAIYENLSLRASTGAFARLRVREMTNGGLDLLVKEIEYSVE